MLRDDDYLDAKVMTASPAQLHLIVLDGAIRHTTLAIDALRSGKFEQSHFSLNDARGFVTELISGMDEGQAADLVLQMRGLFGFVYRNLVRADSQRDPALAEAALRILRLHRETWVELLERIRTAAPDGAGDSAAGGSTRPSVPGAPHAFGAARGGDADDGPHGRSWTA